MTIKKLLKMEHEELAKALKNSRPEAGPSLKYLKLYHSQWKEDRYEIMQALIRFHDDFDQDFFMSITEESWESKSQRSCGSAEETQMSDTINELRKAIMQYATHCWQCKVHLTLDHPDHNDECMIICEECNFEFGRIPLNHPTTPTYHVDEDDIKELGLDD